jgi:hypothetical protein
MEFNIGDVRTIIGRTYEYRSTLLKRWREKHRENQGVFSKEAGTWSTVSKSSQELKTMKLRKNVSVLGAHQYKSEGRRGICIFFSYCFPILILLPVKLNTMNKQPMFFPSQRRTMNPQRRWEFVREKLALFDTGINGISIEKLKVQQTMIILPHFLTILPSRCCHCTILFRIKWNTLTFSHFQFISRF